MQAGHLRHRVTLQSKTAVRDSYGHETITWSEIATVWAAVEPLAGREYLEGSQVEASVDTRIRIRYRTTLDPVDRATFGSHTYDIMSVIHLKEGQKEIHLMCREVL